MEITTVCITNIQLLQFVNIAQRIVARTGEAISVAVLCALQNTLVSSLALSQTLVRYLWEIDPLAGAEFGMK
ncbi:MAG: hypothetical protein ABSH06_29815 [Thermodesulfobacteriota bacterium]|jgi:hypothetical protein